MWLSAGYLTHGAAATRPSQTAVRHSPTLKRMFKTLTSAAPARAAFTVSLAKAEKVVKPPRTPTARKARAPADSDPGRSAIADSAPIAKQPPTFTIRVPNGKDPAGGLPWMAALSQ